MQKMYNLSKWSKLEEGEIMTFSDTRQRTVRLEVNSGSEVQLFLGYEGQDMEFFALVKGRDVIEFSAEDAFSITADGGPVAIYTADGDDWSVAAVDPLSFTRIVERRIRNPDMDRMMFEMQINMEKRFAQQNADFELRLNHERRLARRDAERAKAEAANTGADAGTPADAGGKASAKPAAANDGGSPAASVGSDEDGKKPPAKSS